MIDSSIPLRGQGIQMPDFLGMLGQAEQIRNSRVNRQNTLAGLARQEAQDVSSAQYQGVQRQREGQEFKLNQAEKKMKMAKEITGEALPYLRAIPDPKMRATLLRQKLMKYDLDDDDIGDALDDTTLAQLEQAFGKGQPTPAKPEFLKGANGEFLIGGADGSLKPSGQKFYQEPKAPRQEPQGTIIRTPGQPPMVVKNGVATTIAGAPVDPDKPDPKVNDSQSAAALYGKRIQQAMMDMDSLERAGFDRASPAAGVRAKLPNVTQSENGQRQEQAERNFINALLRRESGAVISPEEFASAAKQYFPRSGDAPSTKEQKKRNREQAFEGLKSASGKAWDGVKLVTEQGIGEVARPGSKAERDSLPSGTRYIGPDGKEAIKQ